MCICVKCSLPAPGKLDLILKEGATLSFHIMGFKSLM